MELISSLPITYIKLPQVKHRSCATSERSPRHLLLAHYEPKHLWRSPSGLTLRIRVRLTFPDSRDTPITLKRQTLRHRHRAVCHLSEDFPFGQDFAEGFGTFFGLLLYIEGPNRYGIFRSLLCGSTICFGSLLLNDPHPCAGYLL